MTHLNSRDNVTESDSTIDVLSMKYCLKSSKNTGLFLLALIYHLRLCDTNVESSCSE